MTAERRKRPPTHPGAILREDVLPALGLSKTETARRLGVSRQTLYDILREKRPVTPAMALRLGKFCGNGPRLWLNMQVAHDLWHESRRVDLSKVRARGGPTRLRGGCGRLGVLAVVSGARPMVRDLRLGRERRGRCRLGAIPLGETR